MHIKCSYIALEKIELLLAWNSLFLGKKHYN